MSRTYHKGDPESYGKSHGKKYPKPYERNRYKNQSPNRYDSEPVETEEKPDYIGSAKNYEDLFLNTEGMHPVPRETLPLAFYAAECYLKDLAWDLYPKADWQEIFPARAPRPAGLEGTHNIVRIVSELDKGSDDFFVSDGYARQLQDMFYQDRYPKSGDRRGRQAHPKQWEEALTCLEKIREACEKAKKIQDMRSERIAEVAAEEVAYNEAHGIYSDR